MWEKEKLLVTSNFSFSHSVFKRLVLQTRKNQGLFGKGLIWRKHPPLPHLASFFDFCGICWRQCHYEFNTVFWKSCIICCAKLKEVDPIILISLQQVSLSIAIKYIKQQRVKINRIRASLSATLSFFNENVYNRYIVLLAQWYTKLCHLVE